MDKQKNNTVESDEDWYADKVSRAYEGPQINLKCLQSGSKVNLEAELVEQLCLMSSVINFSLREVGVQLDMRFINIQNEKTNPNRDVGYIRCKIIKPK